MPPPPRILIAKRLSPRQRQLAQKLGLAVEELPAIETRPIPASLGGWLEPPSSPHAPDPRKGLGLAFSSQAGVRYFFELLGAGPLPIEYALAFQLPENLFCVGEKTATALAQELGPGGDFRIETAHSAEALAERIGKQHRNLYRVLHACGLRARLELREGLEAAGVEYEPLFLYDTQPVRYPPAEVALGLRQAQAVLLASPSAVESLLKGVELPQPEPLWVAIGPTTGKALAALGLQAVWPETPSVEEMLRLTARLLVR